jgi:hypothetical protein
LAAPRLFLQKAEPGAAEVQSILRILTDHKPITIAFHQKRDKCSPRQFNHLEFISQFTTDICHISGQNKVVAITLSRVELFTAPVSHDALAAAQVDDDEMRTLLVSTTALRLTKILIPGTSIELYCDTSSGKPRPYVPSPLRPEIFNSMHSLSHPGIKATALLISQRFVFQPFRKTAVFGPKLANPARAPKFPDTKSPSWQIHPPSSPFPSHSHRPCWAATILGRISILPHGGEPFHALARSLPHP